MIRNSSAVDGSRLGLTGGGCEVPVASMKNCAEAMAIESSSSSADSSTSELSSSRAGNGGSDRSNLAVSDNALSSISDEFRRSLDGMDSGNGHGGRSASQPHRDVVESKIIKMIGRVRSSGYPEAVCHDLRNHISRLPARYILNIDAQRHDDVLLHMNMLKNASKAEVPSKDKLPVGMYSLPQVHVRKVQLVSGASLVDTGDVAGYDGRKSIPIFRIPTPSFGSGASVAGGTGNTESQSTSPSLPETPKVDTSSNGPVSIPPPTFINPLEMDHNSDQEDFYGYEITLATSDRVGLLKLFTNVLSNSPLELNIREAHIFSTTDGMALEIFVIEGWTWSKPEDLREAVLEVLSKRLNPGLTAQEVNEVQLRTAVEGLAYEDWAIEYENLQIGERLGGGSSGRLYRGTYLSQEVAIKVIELENMSVGSESGTLRTVPAAELLHIFKQEVSIMRLVRHKNVVQFIGACSKWPKLCIVTELMLGGSVRDVLQSRGTGLDMLAAVKTLRDAASGMDFLHRRGIVHRDLKAANLLIDEHSVVKVCDFGVARIKPSSSSNLVRGTWTAEMTAETGTYRWMAPEVLEHKPYDHKADIYSFGIMIWEIVTGEVPYADLTPLQAAIGVVQRYLRPTMPAAAPPRLTALAEACWHQDPQKRPEFSEAVAILEELLKPVTKKTLLGRKKIDPFTSV